VKPAAQVEGVVLAAGLSSRCGGRYKMALPLGDKTVIEQSIAGMYGLVSRIWVVVGWQADEVEQLLCGYDKVELVSNPDYAAGMFGSVRVGVARVRARRFFLQPGDCPLIPARVYKQLLAAPGEIVIPTYGHKRGHPVLFDGKLASEILAQPADSTLRDYVHAKGYNTVPVGDRGILLDIDTLQDYDLICELYRDYRL